MAFYDYFMATGDLSFVEASYPKMLSLMDFCLNRRNSGEIKVYIDLNRLNVVTNPSGTGLLRFASGRQPSVNEGVLRSTGDGRYELELTIPDFHYEIMMC